MKTHIPNFDEFPKSDFKKWRSEVKKLLNGEDKDKNLNWSTTPEILLKAYYDEADLASIKYIDCFFSNLQKKQWIQYENVKVQSESQANEQAKSALMGGCEGVLFEGDMEKINLGKIFDGSLSDHRYLAFLHTGDKLYSLDDLASLQGFGFRVKHSSDLFRDQAFTESAKGSIVERSGTLLSEIIRKSSLYEEPKTFFKNLIINIKIGPDFFHEIARLRALRFLIGSIASRYDLTANYLHVHSEPLPGNNESDHLLQQTTEGLAAIIGGTDSVAFHYGNNDWAGKGAKRISRNIGNLLRHESKLQDLQEVCVGSYFIDSLTDRMARSIWEFVTKLN